VAEEALGHHPLRVARRGGRQRSVLDQRADAVRGALLVEQAERRLAHDGDVVGRGDDVGAGAVVGVRGGRRAQGERGERGHGGESAADNAPSSARTAAQPRPTARRVDELPIALSAASGRRCGP